MNNPFHRAAIKAFVETLETSLGQKSGGPLSPATIAAASIVFETKLESQAKAFDACKRGQDISMSNLAHEMSLALYAYRKRVRLDGDHLAAERAFNDHMKPHFEIRLW